MIASATREPVWSSFLLRAETRQWVLAAEHGSAHVDVHDVALDVLRRDYERPARVLLGLIATWAMIISTTVVLATATVLRGYWDADSDSSLAVFLVASVNVAAVSAATLVLLQRSGRRLTRAITRWAATATGLPHPHSANDQSLNSSTWRRAIAPRAAYIAVSGVAIIFTAAATVNTMHDEAGAFVLPLTAATVLQMIVWIGVYAGIHRVAKASLLGDPTDHPALQSEEAGH